MLVSGAHAEDVFSDAEYGSIDMGGKLEVFDVINEKRVLK